jgi:hypothetical protein
LRVGTVDELTTSGERYQIGIDGVLPEAFLDEATAKVLTFTRTQSSLTVDVGSIAELNALIDMLRRHQVSIVGIAKERSTLEESFLNLIKREVAS